jgi:hypothetical protein
MTATKTNTVRTAVDTWVGAAKPAKPHGQETRLTIADLATARAYIYFGAPMPRGATIISAKLRLYTSGSFAGASVTLNVRRLAAKFTASKTTFGNKPAATGTTAALTKVSTGDGDLFEVDVATIMQAIADGSSWYGFEVVTTSATLRLFRAAQAGSKRPELEVTWADAPDAPTTMTPNGQIVSSGKPVVEGDYTDPTGGTLTSVRVQVKTANTGWSADTGFSAATFDSLEVAVPAGSKARLDLNATAYAGSASGAQTFYTMQVKDESGQWSKWSVPASWTFTAKGTLTMSSPTTGAPTVTDFTPPVVFSTSLAMEKYRVIVERTDTGAQVFDSGEVAQGGTAATCTVQGKSGKAVVTTGVPYRVIVRAWDTLDRVSTATDPAYVEAITAFTVTTGATAAVTGFSAAATTLPAPPGVTIDFTSATAPDAFTFTVDGVPVKADVIPSDVLVAGTAYRYTFTGIRPNVAQSFGVSRIVNGIASPIVAASVTPKVSGMWLIDTARDRYLFLAKTGSSSIALGEDSEVLTPLGANNGVRVTQGLRGYSGTISGVLVGASSGLGRTLQQWVDEALAMRARAGRTYVLIVGTEAFEVTIGNLTVRPTGDSTPNLRPCSFDFEQTSDQRIAVTL